MDVDLQLFKNIMKESRNNPDLLDSYSPNQFKSKEVLINHINGLNILNDKSEIIILGSWYGSILIPAFKQVKRITAVDLDENVISIAKNRLFNHYKNVDFICDDVFKWIPDSRRTKKTDLIINTSCEHMFPMTRFKKLNRGFFNDVVYVLQSTNENKYEDHINCVSGPEELAEQAEFVDIMYSGTKTLDNGMERFMVIGK